MKESRFYQEVMEEGRLEAQRAAIREVLQVRFGVDPGAEIEQALRAILDSELSELHRLAVRCRSLAQFRRTMPSA